MWTHKFKSEGIGFPEIGELVWEKNTHAVLEVMEKTGVFKNEWMLAKCRLRTDINPMELSEEQQGSFHTATPLK